MRNNGNKRGRPGHLSKSEFSGASRIKLCEKQNRFVATRFLHISEKRVNLLPFIPGQVSMEQLPRVIRPKLGDRYNAIEGEAYQLKLVCNVKMGTPILAISTNDFHHLHDVVIMQATSSIFAKHLTESIPPLSSFRRRGDSMQDTIKRLCDNLGGLDTLRLRIQVHEINWIRKAWPVMWIRWKRIVLWTHQEERFKFFPLIRTVKVPFWHEVTRLRDACNFPPTSDARRLGMQEISTVVHLLLQCVPRKGNGFPCLNFRKMKQSIVAESCANSCLGLLRRLSGMDKLNGLSDSVMKEIGLIINRVHRKLTLTEYIKLVRDTSFIYDEQEICIQTSEGTPAPLWQQMAIVVNILEQVTKVGLVTLERGKNYEDYRISPTFPQSLREILTTYFEDGELASIKQLKQVVCNDMSRGALLTYLADIQRKQYHNGFHTETPISKFYIHLMDDQTDSFKAEDFETNSDLTCEICTKSFVKRRSLALHLRVHKGSDAGLDTDDGADVTLEIEENSYQTDLQNHHVSVLKPGDNDKQLKCDILETGSVCSNNEFEETLLVEYIHDIWNSKGIPDLFYDFESGGSTFQCSLSDQTFRGALNQATNLRVHSHTTANTKQTLEIDASDFQISIKDRADNQRESNTACLSHCDLCKNVFKNHLSLALHQRVHKVTSGTKKPHKCVHCGKLFDRIYNFNRHAKLHADGKPIQCVLCLEWVSSDDKIESHMRSHTGETPFICKICDKTFDNRKSLASHQTRHDRTTTYNCDLCKKGYKSREGYMHHLKVFHFKHAHSCPFCEKLITRQNTLNDHIREHINEEPYECQICFNVFTTNRKMKRHERTCARKNCGMLVD